MSAAQPPSLPDHIETAFSILKCKATPEKVEAAKQIRKGLTEALKNVTVDGLTQIGNRRHYDETLEKEVAKAHRSSRPLSLLMIDIDHFKHVNDRYGHPMGGKVLQFLAKTIKGMLRTSDEAFRYGGEEFTVLLSATDSEGARHTAELIRETIERLSEASPDIPKITISIGCATLSHQINDKSTLEKGADDALFKAKRLGRNRVEVFNPETHVEVPTSAERHAAEALIRDVQGVEALLKAFHEGNASAALKKGTELGLFPKDPARRKALLEALLKEDERATGTNG